MLAGVHVALFQGAGPLDDDYISYRYARNLARGFGLVYQAGERVEGFTNPLWVLIHAAGLALGTLPAVLTRWLGLGSIAACIACAWRVERALGGPRPWTIATFGIALSPALAFHAVAGLGTTLLAALILGWFTAWLSAEQAGRAPRLAALLLALACLLRQESALFALPFLVASRRRAWAWLPIATLVGWTAFRLAYYGEWLPQTFHVKSLPWREDLGRGMAYLGISTLVAGAGVFALLAAVAPWGQPTGDARRVVGAAAGGVLAHTAYVVATGGDYLALARFFVPALPLALTLAATWLGRSSGGRAAFLAIVAALLWTHVTPVVPQAYWGHNRSYLMVLHEFQEQRWASLGRVFHARGEPGKSVCLSPIGAFGWESDMPIVDVLGLTHQDLRGVEPDLSIPMKGHQRYSAELTLAREPDYIIPGNGVRDPRTGRMAVNPWERDLFTHPGFAAHYTHEVWPIPGGDPLDVWVRHRNLR